MRKSKDTYCNETRISTNKFAESTFTSGIIYIYINIYIDFMLLRLAVIVVYHSTKKHVLFHFGESVAGEVTSLNALSQLHF